MTQTLRYVGDEEAQRAEILRANTRPYPHCCDLPMVLSTYSNSFEKRPQPMMLCTVCQKEQVLDFWPPAPYTFKRVGFAQNNIRGVLKDATWFPYPVGHKYNPNMDNGYILGTVEEGMTTSRLFHAVSHQEWTKGVPYRADYFALNHIRVSRERGIAVFEHYTCG